MKNLLLLFFILPAIAFSQDDSEKPTFTHYKWEVGVNGGLNFATANGLSDTVGTLVKRRGTLFGVTVVYHFNRHFAFKTDFDLESKGWTVENYNLEATSPGGTPSLENITQNLNYFDIPAFLHFGFGDRFKFNFNFGPYIAFLTDAKAYYTDGAGIEIPVIDPSLLITVNLIGALHLEEELTLLLVIEFL